MKTIIQKGLILGLTGLAFGLAACSADSLTVPNLNSPTVAGAGSDPGALQLQASGVLRQLRGGLPGYITTVARFGREGYIYTPNEGRNTSHYLIGLSGQNKLDPAGFATGTWGGNYGNLRDLFNLKNVLSTSTTLSAAQKSAGMGFARTLEALELLYVISTRDSLGAVVQINQDASDLAPFVSRDSVYKYILGTLATAETELAAGGAAFPFTLTAGFSGFNTPTTFRQFNRAVTARAAVYYATRGGGATAWTTASTAIGASFLNRSATTAAAMNAGIYHVFSTTTGDATNGLGQNADFLTHPSYATDLETGDNRSAKWSVLAVARNAPQGLGIATNLAVARYATNVSNVPVIRNEELILLDAEIRWNNGDKAGAVADLNTIRTYAGLAASSVTTASSNAAFEDELLKQRRFSLFAEGHRWVDMRRYGRLDQLPRDLTTGTNAHFVARVMPIPQSECLVRARANDPALAGPGC
ncbi:MAG: RagB/SusD family nutrient uptake outer membrane protein [Gemmatimonadota bacterium]